MAIAWFTGALSRALWSSWCCIPSFIRLKFYTWFISRYGTVGSSVRVRTLPFGLVSKQVQGSPHYEADSIRFVARHTSVPVPRILDVIEYTEPRADHTSVSGIILMTRLEGETLSQWIDNHAISTPRQDDLLEQLGACLEKGDADGIPPIIAELDQIPPPRLELSGTEPIVQDLRDAFKQLRSLPPPTSPSICSVSGGPLCCNRAGMRKFIGPFNSPQEFKDAIFFEANSMYYAHRMPTLRRLAEPVNAKAHRVCFTHADLATRNVLVKDGRLSGIVDWEFAGWYPEYWELVAMESQMNGLPLAQAFWDAAELFGSEPYREELALEWALLCCSGTTALPGENGDRLMVVCPRIQPKADHHDPSSSATEGQP